MHRCARTRRACGRLLHLRRDRAHEWRERLPQSDARHSRVGLTMEAQAHSAQQLAEFLAVLAPCRDEETAIRNAVERAAEAFEAEVAAVVRSDDVVACIGFPAGSTPVNELVAIASSAGTTATLQVPG